MIFWSLGSKTSYSQSKITQEHPSNELLLQTIECAEFDDEAELQAKIWNALVRRGTEVPGDTEQDEELMMD